MFFSNPTGSSTTPAKYFHIHINSFQSEFSAKFLGILVTPCLFLKHQTHVKISPDKHFDTQQGC